MGDIKTAVEQAMLIEPDGTVKPAPLAVIPPTVIEKWDGAAARGLQARNERTAIIKTVLREGPDFDVIPGTKKPTLLKAGAEKISDCLNLWPDYVEITSVEDWEKSRFFYRYRVYLKSRGVNSIVASGIGSCNSFETKYRWRESQRSCPVCKKEAIIKGKQEYGGGWLCFKKKGGCGEKFKDDAKVITDQKIERIENPEICDQVNTIDKMAQKRALIAATLNLGFSEQFTQDMDDLPRNEETEPKKNGDDPHIGGSNYTEKEKFEFERKKMWAELRKYFDDHPVEGKKSPQSSSNFIADILKVDYGHIKTVEECNEVIRALRQLERSDKGETSERL